MADHAKSHPYHLVDPSPWPILGALAGFFFFGGLLVYMHPGLLGAENRDIIAGFGAWIIMPGVLAAMYAMTRWWMDVVREATFEGHHTPTVQVGMRFGMALFIASEVMFFSAFFWAFFNASMFPTEAIGFSWPPPGIETFNPLDVPLLNTLILLTSGFTVTWAHHDIRAGNMRHATRMLVITVLLGVSFTGLQAFEYAEATFGFADGIYPTTFYMATGFHGFHVIIGTLFLAVCLFRTARGHFTKEHHFGFEAAAWYWHFVDVVWLFLYTFVYWWGG